MTNAEKKFISLVYKSRYSLFLVIMTALALFIRYTFLPFESGDYRNFLSIWFEQLRENGGFLAIGTPIGDYNVPYITILACLTYLPLSPLISIKIVSVFFDFLLAISGALVISKIFKHHPYSKMFAFLTYTVILFTPTVILNGSAWAQCDSIYASFILLSFYFLIDNKYSWAFFMYGVAFSFKLQAIFVFPIFIILYLVNRKFSIINFLLIPLANVVLSVPALLLGYPIKDLMLVYFNQTNRYVNLTMNFPSFYTLLENRYDLLKLPGMIITLAIIGVFTMFIWCVKEEVSNSDIVTFSLWCVMIMTFFLPSMHDRYLFVGDILSIIYFIIKRKGIYLPISINLISLSTYIIYLFGMPSSNLVLMSYVFLIIITVFTYDIFKEVYPSS